MRTLRTASIIAATLFILTVFGCAKLPQDMTSLELERACFGSVEKREWAAAKEYCSWVVRIDDYHFGAWGQLCLAEYHLDYYREAFDACSYALNLGSPDPRIHNAWREIGIVIFTKQERR